MRSFCPVRLPSVRAFLLMAFMFQLSCASQPAASNRPQSAIAAPIAAKQPKTHSIHGDKRDDPYFWLKEREQPAVVEYLEAENAYAAAQLKDMEPLQNTIFEEFKSHIPAVEESAPFLDDGYYYYSRQKEGQEYRALYRRKGSLQNPEELLIDFNETAKGQKFFQVADVEISPDNRYLAYASDNIGRRFFDIHILDRKTGKELTTIARTAGNFVWAADSSTLFYAKQDEETLRSDRIFRRNLKNQKEEVIFEEKDSTFALNLRKSRSDAYIIISAESTMTTEESYLPADKPLAKPKIFQPRQRGLEYSIEDGGDRFYILTNHQAQNFQVMTTSKKSTPLKSWTTALAAKSEVFRSDLQVFKTHFVVREREKGIDILRVIDRQNGKEAKIPFPDPVYRADVYVNEVYDAGKFLYSYQSLTKPLAVFSYDFKDGKQTLVKEQTVPNLDSSLYITERVWVKARDGALVPMSLVYKKGLKKDGSAPALIFGYGSYGISMDPTFSATRLSLLDRGFVYAIAHIRGGSELGRPWYENGKLLKKKNTFHDFIDCSQFLIDQKFTSAKHLYAMGGSAGGLLMGAVINERPDLYNGVVANVPFVDVVTSMLDESIPLTTGEYDEWGNPNNKEYYDYMKSYSPYDNVKAQAYPNLLIVTGFHDSQVQYWEPAKWVARLRQTKSDHNLLLLKTNMNAGHGGASGRYQDLKDRALWWAFFLKLEGVGDQKQAQLLP